MGKMESLCCPRISVSVPGQDWAVHAASEIAIAVTTAIRERGSCSLGLTGGATAARLYAYWGATGDLLWDRMHFYFGDERCVPPDHLGSNFGMALAKLGGTDGVRRFRVTRMKAEAANLDEAARQYESELPAQLDVLLLGMGTDGHIASLFPHHPSLMEIKRRVVHVTTDTEFKQRLTVTPSVIAAAQSVFLLATGAAKGRVLAAALESPADVQSLPVRFAIEGTWLLDQEAGRTLSEVKK